MKRKIKRCVVTVVSSFLLLHHHRHLLSLLFVSFIIRNVNSFSTTTTTTTTTTQPYHYYCNNNSRRIRHGEIIGNFWKTSSSSSRCSRNALKSCNKHNTERGENKKEEKDEDWTIRRREFILSAASASAVVGAATAGGSLLGPVAFARGAAAMDSSDIATTNASMKDTINAANNDIIIGSQIPFSSRRRYKRITLQNGLKCVLVSDTKITRISVALSIGSAGQFADPDDIPGLAHLMEHMVMSNEETTDTGSRLRTFTPGSSKKKRSDFELWLNEYDGESNAFTAYDMVCYHFNLPPTTESSIFQESLQRFANLFGLETIKRTCQNDVILSREVRRVDSELDFTTYSSKSFYLLKHLMNKQHPFSRFSSGSIDTLERVPNDVGIDVGLKLYEFFSERYQASKSCLVVAGNFDLTTLERYTVAPFRSILSQNQKEGNNKQSSSSSRIQRKKYAEPFLYRPGTKPMQIVLQRSLGDGRSENIEKLSFEWPLRILYDGLQTQEGPQLIAPPAVAFVISQMIARRGPGSLYKFLLKRGWIPQGMQGLPKITFPVNVSGFQILKLDMALTLSGFANRSAVIAAFYNTITRLCDPSQSFLISREKMCQYITVATLHGYALAQRPPDAVELAVDAQTYGVGGNGIGVDGVFPLVPSVDDSRAVDALRRAVAYTLNIMSEPESALIIVSASTKAISSSSSFVDKSLPSPSSRLWKKEPVSGGLYYTEDMMGIAGKVEMWAYDKLDEDEIGEPKLNPLIPFKLRLPRLIIERASRNGSRFFYLESKSTTTFDKGIPRDAVWREFLTQTPTKELDKDAWEQRATASSVGKEWKIYQVGPTRTGDIPSLPLPLSPPELTCRCSLVIQLVSARPARAKVKQAARSQLWLLSFENTIADLAELGAPGGLAYDISFNKFGLRICFLGISQTLPSYSRRFCRRLLKHHKKLLDGSETILPSTVDIAVDRAKRLPYLSQLRKREVIAALIDTTRFEAGVEGLAFLKSCNSGAVCLAQGDLLPREVIELIKELQDMFNGVLTNKVDDSVSSSSALPDLQDIVYKPYWKPRGASSCSIPGVTLVSDACGRIQR